MRYRRRSWPVRALYSGWLWSGLMVVAIVATIVIWVLANRQARRECEEEGGTVIEVHGVRDTGWFCQPAR